MKISEFVQQFEKYARKKPSTSKAAISKLIDKAKAEFQKNKSEMDSLESQFTKLEAKLNQSREVTGTSRRKLMDLYNIIQMMDLSGATGIVQYNNSNDIGYIINGKEYHIENNNGDIKLHNMRAFRKDKKHESESDLENELENPSENEEFDPSEEDIDALCDDLMR